MVNPPTDQYRGQPQQLLKQQVTPSPFREAWALSVQICFLELVRQQSCHSHLRSKRRIPCSAGPQQSQARVWGPRFGTLSSTSSWLHLRLAIGVDGVVRTTRKFGLFNLWAGL